MSGAPTSARAAAHVILHTHTPLRLRRTILGVACQTRRPDTLTVSCDSDNPEIEAVCRACAAEFAVGMTLILRGHTGKGRSAQAKNNAVRSLLARSADRERSVVIFFDGDCVPEPAAVERHERMGRAAGQGGGLVIGRRFNLTEAQDGTFDEAALRAGRWPVTPSAEEVEFLARRHRTYQRQAFLKRFGLAKEHKPKVLGSNFSVPLAAYTAINGHDETYEGWGGEDDDLGRRLYRSGVRPIVAVKDIAVFHQWHKTLAPGAWHDAPNSPRLTMSCETVCAKGLNNPAAQPEPREIAIDASGR